MEAEQLPLNNRFALAVHFGRGEWCSKGDYK